MINRIKDAVRRHEAQERHLDRLDRLDHDDMTLTDLYAEHHVVKIRLHLEIYPPEGKAGLEEREDALLKAIKRKERYG